MAARMQDALPPPPHAAGAPAAGAATPPLGAASVALGQAAGREAAEALSAPLAGEPTRLLTPGEVPGLAAWLEAPDGRRLDLEGSEPFLLGRGEGCHWRERDRSVSRRHARIERVGGGFAIEDLGSLNGVRVNGQRVPRTLLADGDEITLGEVRLRFRCRRADLAPPPASTAPAPRRAAGPRRLRPTARLAVLASIVLAALLAGAAALWWQGTQRPAPHAGARPAAEAPPAGAAAGEAVAGPVPPAPGRGPGPRAGAADVQVERADAPPPVPPPDGAARNGARAGASGAGEGAAAVAPKRRTVPARASGPRPVRGRKPPHTSRATDPVAAALDRYRRGDVAGALAALETLAVVAGPAAERARAARADLVALDTLYREGEAAYARGEPEAAARIWLRLVETERERLGAASSARVAQVRARIAAHFAERARAAEADGRMRDAWRLWRRAAALDPEGEGGEGLARLREAARRLYREGYRYETVDLARAREAWRRLIEMAPPDDPYRIKAEARLAWHDRLEALRER